MKFLYVYVVVLFSIILTESIELEPGFIVENYKVEKYEKSIDILIVSIDPQSYDLEIFNVSDMNASLKDISSENGYILVFNAGMFDVDYKTSMGYMKKDGNILNSRNHPNYESLIAFNPNIDSIPNFYIYDSDETSFDSIVKQYDSVIENLRLIKRPGINRWPKQDKRWSEIAIGQDIDNNIIVIYCSSILSMFELNEILLSLPIELQVAQHLEGNSLAQLYLKMNQYEINHDHNLYVPNLIGVRSKSEN